MPSGKNCPNCGSENAYSDGNLWTCPDCADEWTDFVDAPTSDSKANAVDAYGNTLNNGDSVTVIKELKIKSSSSAVKVGTKVKNIRLIESDDGHNISCKIDGIGAINLKSEFVKKA